ncbi:MAG: hypothetical protein APF77_07090 [Clostridia bacterium BRH_c25]|nr:MAG: hypothetical protein APF77_07090 [Clostridia bacterium BRH_c25]
MYAESLLQRIVNTKTEWEKFIWGKPVDPKLVPSRIIKSWERSRSYGVFPDVQGSLDDVHDTSCSYLSNEAIRDYVREMLDKFGYWFQLFDRAGKPVTAPMETIPATERLIGTNAVSFALEENRPATVLCYEHYHPALHKYYSAAAPVHDHSGKILGAVNIMCSCKDTQLLSNILPLATFLARIIDTANALLGNYKPEAGLETVINCLPQGIACFENGKMMFHNNKIMEMFQINNAFNASEILEKQLSHLAEGAPMNKRRISLYIEGRKKDLYVTSLNPIQSGGREKYRILQLEKAENGICSGENSLNVQLTTLDRIIGESCGISNVKKMAERVAAASAPILIYGESGTGKELFAQAIHQASPRRGRPFVTINCGAVPAELVESELFGYEPGAFTGALKNGKQGLMEMASGGTVFLDEIESMPLFMQVKLLRSLSESRIVKIGGTREIAIDVRVISASKKDLLKEAEKESFRGDLYYRISTFIIQLPPLREREGDIKLLAGHFIEEYKKIYGNSVLYGGEEFYEALKNYDWHGNVRELKNVMERAVCLAEEPVLTLEDLPEHIRKKGRYKQIKIEISNSKALREHPGDMLKVGEELIIESVLKETQFNINKACEILGVSSKTLYNKINGSTKLSRLKTGEISSGNKLS